MPGLSRPPASLVTVIGIAVAVALTATVLFETSDVLPRDVAAALTPTPWSNESPDSGQLNLVIVHGPPSDVTRGMQIALLVFVLGNVPAALVAGVLAARRSNRRSRRWTARSADVFFAGFIFQAGGLLFTGLLFAVLVAVASDSAHLAWEMAPFGGMLFASLVCSFCGLRSWRVLESEAREWRTLTRIDLAGRMT